MSVGVGLELSPELPRMWCFANRLTDRWTQILYSHLSSTTPLLLILVVNNPWVTIKHQVLPINSITIKIFQFTNLLFYFLSMHIESIWKFRYYNNIHIHIALPAHLGV